ncbi:tail fiber domain-containing protein [Pantoea agglomerans]|uniref:tail fiber domain-containing protein n=1 Tax=Enterobacter agglomerans TaxID=549 RepID=UPI0021663F96|nr:tail fiber domain-containing protein [Pantoea agglomerans]UVV74335.1 tail fiber domain-containing protein [Pantoea agglomerans]
MPAGTIALTNNSTAVTGTGTSFTAELKANDFVVAVVGGVAYTLGIKSVDSNTALTLAQSYTGPAASGLAWTPVPFGTMTAITAQLAAQVTYAVRGFNLDKANWQGIFTGSGNVTVNLPDGTSWTGPAWNGIAQNISGKLDKSGGEITGNLTVDKDLTVTGKGTIGGALAQSGGATFYNGDILIDSGEVVAKKVTDAGSGYYNSSFVKALLAGRGANGDSRGAYAALLCQEQSGVKFSGYVALNGFGSNILFEFRNNGNAYAPQQWVSSSDKRIKTNIKKIEDPLVKMRLIKGVTWDRLDRFAPGIGFIAQDVQAAFPSAVSIYGDMTMSDGTIVKDVLAPDTTGVAAALHHEAILALMDKIEKQDAVIAELQGRMKAIDGLDA